MTSGRARRAVLGAVLSAGLPGAVAAEIDAPRLAWGYSTLGIPGLVDMPVAYGREDAELAFILSHFRSQTRMTLTFQVTDRLSGSFRYSILDNIRSASGNRVVPRIYDRSFSLHYRLMDEGRVRPALAVGINDLGGTGIYGGEYLVASKTLSPRLRASLGIGWGRLGGDFANPFGVLSEGFRTRPAPDVGQGGKIDPKAWFRGDAALFGGVEWQATDRLRLVAEYSSDDYRREDGTAFRRRSPLNFGASWQAGPQTTVTANYLYGSEIGVQVSYALNPRRAAAGAGRDPAPPPLRPRGPSAAMLGWPVVVAGAGSELSDAMAREGLALNGQSIEGSTLRVDITNIRYGQSAQALGRAARVLTQHAPDSVDRFAVTLTENGMRVSTVILSRDRLESLEFAPDGAARLRAGAVIADGGPRLPAAPGRYPAFDLGLAPYISTSLFDPDQPVRADVGLALRARFEPAPGIVISGRVQHRLAGNLDQGDRPPDSVLPRVRSDAYLYFKGGATTIPELTAAWYFRPGQDLYGRVTAGYLEPMFGGVSAELLWKPQAGRLALGVEVNQVRQRDFDQRLGFRRYRVATGHVSAYYDFGNGFLGQVDLGRYLAGDVGATVSLDREFANGWRVGAFATRTNVSSADFGEGSFDKGIRLTVPLDWVTGRPSRAQLVQTVRPVQRDGGARLEVSGRLFETVRGAQASGLDRSWGRFWK